MQNWPNFRERREAERARQWSNRPRHWMDRRASRLMKRLEKADAKFDDRYAASRLIIEELFDTLFVGTIWGMFLFVVLAVMMVR